MKNISFLVGFILLTSICYSVSNDDVKSMLNSNVGNSDIMKSVIGTERLNIEVQMNDGSTKKYGVITKDGAIEEFNTEFIENPTLSVYTTENDINELNSDPNKIIEVLNRGGIRFKSENFFVGFKLLLYNLFLKIASIVVGMIGGGTTGNFLYEIPMK